jgi:hypothetical protein
MSVLIDVLGWSIIALGAISAAARLGSLVIDPTRARRPRGVHARPHLADPGERRNARRELRKDLLIALTGVTLLLLESRDHVAKWLVGTVVIVIVFFEIRAWFSETEPRGRIKAWREHGSILLPAAASLSSAASGWRYATWMMAFVVLMISAPDLDVWIRSRINRQPGDAAAQPP